MEQARAKRWGKRTRIIDRDQGKAILVKVALECYARYGIENTCIESVAQRAGVSRRTFYRYFSGKTDLRREVFQHCMECLFQRMRVDLKAFKNNLPRLFEESIVFASRFQYPSGDNAALTKIYDEIMESVPFAMPREWGDEWYYFFEDALVASSNLKLRQIDPKYFSDLASRLVLVYRQFGDCPDDIRTHIKTLKVMSEFAAAN